MCKIPGFYHRGVCPQCVNKTSMFIKKKNNTELRVSEEALLMDFLIAKYGGSRNNIKGLLARRVVNVNGSIQTRHDTPLHPGDVVTVVAGKGNAELTHPKLKIVYEDDYLIVVEKKQGLLTVATYPGSTETTVFSILKAYVRRQNQRAGIYTVHRLDRETSGLLVFAKTPELQEYMRTYWRQLVTKRTYVAIAEGRFGEKQGQIVSWFTEDKKNAMVYSSPVDDGGQKAITNYKVIKETTSSEATSSTKGTTSSVATSTYSLVELNLETGRTNQIRVHLATKGHPVVGDRKYGHGNDESPIDRLCLHARVLEFIHPATEQKVHFETPTPKEFLSLFK